MKIRLWSGIVGALLLIGLLAFSFSLHGTVGFFRVNGVARLGYFILFGFGLLLLILTLLENFLLSRKNGKKTSILSLFVRTFTALAVLFTLGAFYYVGDFFTVLPDTTPRLLLAEGTQTSGIPNLAVTLQSAEAVVKSIRWGDDSTLIGSAVDMSPTTTHTFLLSGLKPASVYWYRIDFGTVYSFTTPSLDRDLKFAVFSDAHFGDTDAIGEMESMIARMADPDNGFEMIFSLGDLVDFGFRSEQWAEAFETFTPATTVLPSAWAAGNHDALFTGVNDYKTYSYPPGLPLESGNRLWRRIDSGRVHFLILDVEWSAETVSAAQVEWLEAQLQTIPTDDWTMVMSHGFYYSSGYVSESWQWYDNPETIDALTPLFEQYDVDIVFSGHNHQTEVLQKNGVTYVICGVFGGEIDPDRTYISPASVWFSVDLHAFVEVEISGDAADVSFRVADGSIMYNFTLTDR